MICGKCGKENPEDAKFCGECAAPLTAEVRASNSQEPAATVPPVSQGAFAQSNYMENNTPPKKGMPAWGWILIVLFGVCACGGVLLAAVLFPVFSQARVAAKTTLAVSNAKQVATATAIYLTDFDDRFPVFTSSRDVAEKLKPYLPKPSGGGDSVPVDLFTEASAYTWNDEISGKSAMTVLDLQGWMFFDPRTFGEKTVVAHLDSSVRAETQDQFAATKAIRIFGTPTQ